MQEATVYNPESIDDRRLLGTELINLLQEKRFQEEESTGERIFSFAVNERTRVMIYTTVVGLQARAKDKDAIRVAGVYKSNRDEQDRGLIKVARVYRTGKIGDIVERTIGRAREVWKRLHAVEKCSQCGAPMFISKKGNPVCSEICWDKK